MIRPERLAYQDHALKEGSIVEASIISAPTSTKNESGQRDPEMHSVKKGNQWYFGMKVHIVVDDTLELIHSLETTSAEVNDIVMADELLYGEEQWALAMQIILALKNAMITMNERLIGVLYYSWGKEFDYRK